MNDAKIRENFHRKTLRRYHQASDTLVIDELGLQHGTCRADIAVINGHFLAYEIKSDQDSLCRITKQVKAYNAVFDEVTVVVGQRHLEKVKELVPLWWGIMVASANNRGTVHFETIRPAAWNHLTDDYCVAQLLWKGEAEEELAKRGISGKILKQNRSILYRELVGILEPHELRKVVRSRLKARIGWRCPVQPF